MAILIIAQIITNTFQYRHVFKWSSTQQSNGWITCKFESWALETPCGDKLEEIVKLIIGVYAKIAIYYVGGTSHIEDAKFERKYR